MAKPLTTHREILRGLLLGAPIGAVLVCVVWFVAVGTTPSSIVWALFAVVLCLYLLLASVAWINSWIASRKRRTEPSDEVARRRSAVE
jgi:hypothetical protein